MKLLFTFVVVFMSFLSVAQEELWFEARAKGGYLIAHRSIMGHLATEHSLAGEFSLVKQAGGERFWQRAYNYPQYGATVFFGSTGNRELLGYQIGGQAFIRLPILRTEKFSLWGKMGMGLTYGTKVYDANDSLLILSMALGSHVNALVSLGVDARFELGKHYMVAGIDMTHISNGATKVPNFGLNLPYISLGYGYHLKHSEIDTCTIYPAFDPYWEFGALGIASLKQVNPVGGKTYPCFSLNLMARRYFKQSAGLEISFDIFSKQAIKAHVPEIEKTQMEMIQLGLFAGYIMPFDKMHIVMGMGCYVRDKFKPEDPFYHRIGVRYVFDNGINLNLVLKSHYARADYIEYGVAYTFKK